jgi:hypothetical protein
MEIWKQISGYEGLYEVSSLGRVRGVDRTVSSFSHKAGKVIPLKRRGKILSQSSAGAGYMTVCLCKDGGTKTMRVAALVCTAFHGAKPEGMQVCHNDGHKTNNHKDNLRWDTPANNQHDRIIHATDLRGEAVSTAKLTSDQASAIKAGMKLNEAKKLFGISKSQYYRILRGESWAHIKANNVQF